MGRRPHRPTLVLRWLVAGVLLAAVWAPGVLADRGARVLPPKAHPYGQSYAEWAAEWWGWALEQPVAANPLLDTTGAQCASRQQGKVWFLAGAISGEPVTRTCTVPHGKALLFPVVNSFYCAEPDDPPAERTVAFAREQVAAVRDATALTATVDGVAVRRLRAYFGRSAVFSIVLPADTAAAIGAPELAGVTLEPCVDAGYYLVVKPLRKGSHTLHFAGTLGDFNVDVTYELRVVRKHRRHDRD